MDIASIVPINIGRGWGEGSHQLARPFGQGGWSCPAPSPQPSPARGEGARSPFDQGRYCYFNGIATNPASTVKRPWAGRPYGQELAQPSDHSCKTGTATTEPPSAAARQRSWAQQPRTASRAKSANSKGAKIGAP